MMYFKLSVIAVISCLVCVCTAAEGEKPLVGVYYETYCPDSIKFITKQLYPAYLKLNSSLFVPQLVPYGNANTTTNNSVITFQCQHGEKECYGNKVHACVLSSPTPGTLQNKLKFVNCTLAKTDTTGVKPYPIEECAKESGLDSLNITSCANGSVGVDLLAANGNATKQYNITSVPSVTFNTKFDKALSDRSVKDFNSVLCQDFFKGDSKADVLCKPNSASAATLTVLPVIVFTFLFSKMY